MVPADQLVNLKAFTDVVIKVHNFICMVIHSCAFIVEVLGAIGTLQIIMDKKHTKI